MASEKRVRENYLGSDTPAGNMELCELNVTLL